MAPRGILRSRIATGLAGAEPQEWGRDHRQVSTFIGLDGHRATISVAIARGERGGEVRHLGTIPHRPDSVRKLVEKLAADGSRLNFCYEAGPCGYGLHRQLVDLGHDGIVVAPSLTARTWASAASHPPRN